MKIFIVGGSGQVGTDLQVAVQDADMEFTVPSHNEFDIADKENVVAELTRQKPSLVVNCAAYTAVDLAEDETEMAFSVNAGGPANLAIACERLAIPLLHISTDYVFDGQSSIPYKPSDQTNPINAYGRSKEAGERAVRENCRRHIILRTAWVNGASGNNFVKAMLGRADLAELRVVSDQIGCPTFCPDIAAAIVDIANTLDVADNAAGDNIDWGTHHYCGLGETTWFDFAQEIFRQGEQYGYAHPAVTPIMTHEYPLPALRPNYSVLDCGTTESSFSTVRCHWPDSLARMLAQMHSDR